MVYINLTIDTTQSRGIRQAPMITNLALKIVQIFLYVRQDLTLFSVAVFNRFNRKQIV